MKRLIDYYLKAWINDPYRKPLLLRGARQVGKTHAARQLGKLFENFIEINLELDLEAHPIFTKDLKPDRIIRELSALTKKTIIPGETPATIAALEATFLPAIEATSNVVAIAGGIAGGVATGPV